MKRGLLPRRGDLVKHLDSVLKRALFVIACAAQCMCRTGDASVAGPVEAPRSDEAALASAAGFADVGQAEATGVPVGPSHSLLALSRGELWATWNRLRGDEYELDTLERFLEDGQNVRCDQQTLVRHGGTHVRYESSVRVNPAFRERLERFERVVNDVAVEI